MSNALDDTRRLLSLVAYLRERPGARLEDVARAFGHEIDAIEADLGTLHMCGTSFMADDLLEPHVDADGRVWLDNADAPVRPVRLAPHEALTLLVALRALAGLSGLRDRDREALGRVTAKLEDAAGDAAQAAAHVRVEFEAEDSSFATMDRAIAEQRALRLSYYVPRRDEVTERIVDPVRLLLVEGRSYLLAWCRTAEDRRLFRLDRVVAAELLDDKSAAPTVAPFDPADGLVQPTPEDIEVVLELGPGGRWVREYYPYDALEELPDGGLRLTLRTPDPSVVRRLALRLGEHGRVVAPAELADDIRRTAAAALAAYATA
ncbi:MAG TPA: WYL domain-containing protein [Yinghuangia sp.]|uniref:helix-turn-helix transcriptional regulator n=1 Tax=Yinghuangia sp. YIM S10712 TaxID=3436930 RepID=UPI002B92997E|nr:WYL domain-containing protein [Yinghuangia sp.]